MAGEYKVVVTAKGKRSLNNLYRYVLSVSNMDTVLKVRQLIEDGLERIGRMPTFRSIYVEFNGQKLRLYEAKKKYFILYGIVESDKRVKAIYIGSVKMNLPTILAALEEE